MITMHPHQMEARESILTAIRAGARRVLLQSPTGSGKTVLAASIANGAAGKGNRTFFVVHRQELVSQSLMAFSKFGIDCGVIAAGFTPRQAPVQVAMVGMLAHRLEKYPAPQIVVIDEAHHAVAATWSKLLARVPNSVVIGLTATPERLDGTGLSAHFQHLITGKPVAWLIENGFLSPYRAFSPQLADTSAIKSRAGDFAVDAAREMMDRPTITGDAIGHYRRLADGQRMIVFCTSVDHSRHVASSYRSAGIEAEHVDGDMLRQERDAVINRFRTGQTMVLTNVNLISEGFDVPDAVVVQLLRPTKSLAMHLQMIGRVLRFVPGKTAIILDHVGNISRLGLPDTPHEWTLEGKKRRQKQVDEQDAEFFARQCPKCDAWMKLEQRSCQSCGFVFPAKVREKIKEQAGELIEIKKESVISDYRKKLSGAKTLEELRQVERASKYRPGWAEHVYRARMRRG
ncbi:MAG: DEAD/DEAH box helicase [Magnetococcus sp. THC-1_WYH]